MLSDEGDFAPPPSAAEDTWSRFTSLSKSKQGGALILEMLFCLISAICLLSSLHAGYATCPLIEMIFAGIFYWVYMNGHSERIPYLDWVWTDIFRCVTATVSLLVISLICIARGRTGSIAGGVFGLAAAAVFIYNLNLLYPRCQYQASLPGRAAADGRREVDDEP